jgi:2-polyprenyl-3-methyl-5-hydroxy-6-metoxy-1,4-benzoquinol methylase
MSAPQCPACGQAAVEPIERINVADQHALLAPAEAGLQQRLTAVAAEAALEYAMFRCRHCGLEFSSPLRAPSADWYRLAYEALDLYPADRWEFDRVLRHVHRGEELLELGCGAGALLEQCRQRGLAAAGVDFSAAAVRLCRERGLRAHQMDLVAEPEDEPCRRVAHIVGFHVLEHLDRPGALFQFARHHALPAAHLWLSVPSERRPTRALGQRDFLDQPPHHLTRWNPAACAALGARHGWRLVQVLYEPITLRVALWWISVCSPAYLRWKTARRFRNRWIERGFRALFCPFAVLQRLTTLRHLSGHSMLAHFVLEAGQPIAGRDGNS